MPLQSSASGADPLKLSEIKTEFGGPDNLRAYLNGGTYVPSSPLNSGIPSSGTLKILDFLSSSAGIGTVNIPTSFGVNHARTGITSSGTATASLSMRTDTTYVGAVDTTNVPTNWLTGSDAWAGGWQLRFTLVNNYGVGNHLSFTNTSNNTWTTVTTNQTVTMSTLLSSGLQYTNDVLIEARKVGTTTVVDSGTLQMVISYQQQSE